MRTIVAAFLAALVIMIWSVVSWMALPWHLATIHTIPDGEAVATALADRVDESGIYHYPGVPEEQGPSAEQAWVERFRAGPNINLLAFSVTGFDPVGPWLFVRGFLLIWVAAILAAALLAGAALPRYGHRVLFVALLGGFAAVQTRLVDWNWWSLPLDFTLVMAVDLVVTWTLAGLVLAWRIRPPTALAGAALAGRGALAG